MKENAAHKQEESTFLRVLNYNELHWEAGRNDDYKLVYQVFTRMNKKPAFLSEK